MNKEEVRKLIKERHREHKDQLSSFNDQLSENLADLLSNINSKKNDHGFCLGGYSPLSDEPIWWYSLEEKEILNKIVLVHMHDEIKLTYHSIDPKDLMNKKLGLQLDITGEEVVPGAILIPGVAFDGSLNRIGRGKGYFDSYLKSYKGIKIGIFFSYQEIEEVPTEAHDEKLDFIVTNKKIYRRG